MGSTVFASFLSSTSDSYAAAAAEIASLSPPASPSAPAMQKAVMRPLSPTAGLSQSLSQSRSPSVSSSSSSSSSSWMESDSKFSEDELLHTRTLLLSGSDVGRKRDELRSYFHRTFSLYEALFDLLTSDAAFYEQPDALRHPLIFYYGHTAVFFINKLVLARLVQRRIEPHIESLCAIGVDEMSWDDVNAKNYDWPTVQAVRDYRDAVRVAVDRVISNVQFTLPITAASDVWPLLMGCEHERIHLETSSVLFRQLPLHHISPNPRVFRLCPEARSDPAEVPANRLVPVPAAKVVLGRTEEDDTYGWDNEYGKREADVAAFQASAFLVSNAEFLPFVQAGGYSEPRWWTEEGWKYVQYRQLTAPLFWIRTDEPQQRSGSGSGSGASYRYRSMAQELDMPWDWPVDVNYLEAKAFCNWKAEQSGLTVRLPTEAEWTALRDWAYPAVDADCRRADQPYWPVAPGNINLEHWASASPVDRFPFGSSGLYDVIGNVWQHTETPIAGLRGFAFHPLYDDFSVPTFDGRHHLIKGGSFISTGNESLRVARYAFRRHFMQHAGFRYIVSDAPLDETAQQIYTEADPAVCTVLHQHFAPHQPLGLPNVHTAIASTLLQTMQQQQQQPALAVAVAERSALVLGCGAGRSCFELARSGQFSRVVGADGTARLIRLASHLQLETSGLQYCLCSEGELLSYHEVDLRSAGLELTPSQLQSLWFVQADVNNLATARFGAVSHLVLAQVLEQLRQPAAFLRSVHQHVLPGGLLLIASSFAWDEQRTAKRDWLGGRRENGESVSSVDGLHDALRGHFTMVGGPRDLPAIELRSDRDARLLSLQLTVWRRTSTS